MTLLRPRARVSSALWVVPKKSTPPLASVFSTDRTRQDAAILNVQRACETAIDLAQHWVQIRAVSVPASSRDLFTLLESAHLVEATLVQLLRNMVGFRNGAVHEYQQLDLAILAAVIERELDQILRFTGTALRAG